MEESTSLKRDIIETRKVIQEKCNLLKRKRDEMDKYYNMKYRPIIGPLNELLKVNDRNIALHPTRPSCLPIPESPSRVAPIKEELTPARPQWTEETIETPSTPLEMICEEASTSQGQEIIKENLDELGQIALKYIVKFIRNETEDLDDVYGIRYDGSNFTIGDTIINIKYDELFVDDDSYIGTPGLFELLFMNNPDSSIVKDKDLATYKKILQKTNAQRKRYSSTGSVNEIRTSNKYRRIISKLFQPPKVDPRKKKGFGLEVDPNTIVERLKIILKNKNSHRKEIKAIEARLRIGGIIE
jgi:hypothetical protein